MTKRKFLDIVFALAPNEANRIMDAFDEYVESTEQKWIPWTGVPDKDGQHPISAEVVLEVVKSQLSTDLAEVGTDLISRQAAIDALKDWYDGMIISSFRGIEKVIDALPPVQPTIQPEPHWIPVEQDLPKIGEYVLCETTTRYFGKYHVCKFVDKDEWVDKPHFDWDRNGFPHVVAWTRFEPYKGVTE